MNMLGRFVEDRFELTSIVGEGGMSVVYAARDRVSGRKVAVKVLKQVTADPSMRERFLREAESQGAIDSPRVAQIYHFGRDMELNLLFIVMEFCEGEILYQTLERGPLALRDGLDVAIQVGEGLMAAHAVGVIHRDIKPANILVGRFRDELRVKLLDFGYVRVQESSKHLTQDGFVGGTLSYISPEELELSPLDTRLDIYSAGCVFFEMFEGRPPFVAKTPQAVAVKHLAEPPPRLSQGAEELVDLVHWMMQKSPDSRPQTMAEVVEYLSATRALC